MSLLSKTGMTTGLIIAIGNFVRYYVIWFDADRAIMYPLIGIMISLFSFLYGRQKDLLNTLDNLEEHYQEHILGEKND